MANGVIVPSQAVWTERMQLGDVEIEGSFEVFDSKGSWAFLLRKPLLRLFDAKQDFVSDTVIIGPKTTVLHNKIKQPNLSNGLIGTNLLLDMKQAEKGGPESKVEGPAEPIAKNQNPESTLTRETCPWKPECVERILKEVTFGWDITESERNTAKAIIAEFADCFVLSIKEVNTIPGAMHKLNIPEDTTFKMKIPPRLYNLDQRAFMETKIDEMLEAGVICRIHPRDVQFVAQMVLAQKTHEGEGLTLDELEYQVNSQCVEHGLPSEFEMPPQLDAPRPNMNATQNTPKKWRMCQDFGGINKVTEIAPVPQGDIRAKQLCLSGHRYIHTCIRLCSRILQHRDPPQLPALYHILHRRLRLLCIQTNAFWHYRRALRVWTCYSGETP